MKEIVETLNLHDNNAPVISLRTNRNSDHAQLYKAFPDSLLYWPEFFCCRKSRHTGIESMLTLHHVYVIVFQHFDLQLPNQCNVIGSTTNEPNEDYNNGKSVVEIKQSWPDADFLYLCFPFSYYRLIVKELTSTNIFLT